MAVNAFLHAQHNVSVFISNRPIILWKLKVKWLVGRLITLEKGIAKVNLP